MTRSPHLSPPKLAPLGPAPPGLAPEDIADFFGDIDVYLFDQIQKGRLPRGTRLLDAGCGPGRNLVYPLRAGMDVWGVDRSEAAVAETRRKAEKILGEIFGDSLDGSDGKPLDESFLEERFRVSGVEDMPFPDGHFDVVVVSAVLHFAPGTEAFLAMVREAGRVLRPGGMLFTRLATTIGMEDRIEPLGDRRYRLPQGQVRFLADRELLDAETARLGDLLEPIKTTLVEDLRAMTTWVVRKAGTADR